MQVFEGLRVVDLSPTRVGAQVSQLFADFGADVVMVEPPGGASMRRSPAFPFWARGKQSVELDLGDPGDRDRLLEMVDGADVLVETFRPGTLEHFGISGDMLAQRNPRLVHTSITGFGTEGPYANVRGYEGIVAAKLGVFQSFARMATGDAPPFVNAPWCSFAASQLALHGTLAALLERETSGLGQRVDTNLAHSFGALDTWAWFEHLIETKWPDAFQRTEAFDADRVPASPFPYFLLVAPTSDGHWLQFAQVAPHLFVALMQELGLAGLFQDPAWQGIPVFDDAERRLGLWDLMLQAASEKSLAEWQAVFDTNPEVFAEVFRRGPEVLEHPQLVHDGMVVELEDTERGPVRQPGPLVHRSGDPARITRSAPRLGEHGESAWPPRPVAAVATAAPAPAPPLAGYTVVELALLFAAPYGTTLLADLGARVIKVESLEGDPIRTIIPFPESGGAKVMQGKESICVDLGTPEGLDIVKDLLRTADAVVLGYRAGVADRLGLDHATVRGLNPDIVILDAPGYGVGPPNGHRPAYAPSIGAAAGIAQANLGDSFREQDELTMEQVRLTSIRLQSSTAAPGAQADGFAALGVASAVLLGLLGRARGAGAAELVTTMLNTNAHAMSAQTVDYPGSPGEPAPGPDLRGLHALYRVYDASDGWVFLAAPTEREWRALVTALASHADLAGDRRFASTEDRTANDAELVDVLSAVFATRGKEDWERDLLAADVACVSVTTAPIESMYCSEEFGRASGYLADVVHPVFDEHPRLAAFPRFSRSITPVSGGVLAGAHTDSLLAELGHDDDAIADLRARRVVG